MLYHPRVIFFDLDDTLVDDRFATIAGIVALRRFRPETVDGDPAFLERWLLLTDRMFQRYLDGVPEYQNQGYRTRKRIQGIWPESTDWTTPRSVLRSLAAPSEAAGSASATSAMATISRRSGRISM